MMSETDIEKMLWMWVKSGNRTRFVQGLIYALVRILQLDEIKMKGGDSACYIPDIEKYLRDKYE